MNRRILSWILVLVMSLSLFPAGALAAEDVAEPAAQEETLLPEALDAETESSEPDAETLSAPAETEPETEEETLTVEATPDGEAAEDPAADGEEKPAEENEEPVAADEEAAEEEAEPQEFVEQGPVVLRFVTEPEGASVTVYTRDEQGEKQTLEPNADECYALLPGIYFFDAACEDLPPVEGAELRIERDEEAYVLTMTMPGEEPARFCPNADEVPFELPVALTVGTPRRAALGASAMQEGEAEGEIIASGECGADGDNLTWVLTGDGRLIIRGTGKMADYSFSDDSPWYYYRNRVQIAELESGVTSIGNYAFHDCNRLTCIFIPPSVNIIGSGSFTFCSSLAAVHISDLTTWCTIIFSDSSSNPLTQAKNLYMNNELVQDVIIPEDVTSIGSFSFSGCNSLKSVVIPASVTSFGAEVFKGCDKLKSAGPIGGDYNIQFGWTETIPENAFYSCYSLTNVDIPSGLTSIGANAFRECHALSTITLPASLTSIGKAAFFACYSLTRISIPNAVADIGGYAFQSCTSLTDVVLPANLTSIEAYLFKDCSSLTSIFIPDNVTRISDWAFQGCSNLETVTIPESVTSFGPSVFENCNKLKSAGPVGSNCSIQFGWVSEIPPFAFENCKGLISVSIPDGMTSIGQQAFCWCSSLTSVSIPDSITKIGIDAFYECTALMSISIPDSVSSIEPCAFERCSSLKSVSLPSNMTVISSSLFKDCCNLKEILIPQKVTWIIQSAFEGCTSLTDVYYAGTRRQWENMEIGEYNDPLLNATIHFAGGEEPAETYAITIDPTITGGTVSVTNSAGEPVTAAVPGETLTLRCTPDTGYAFSSAEAENSELGICAVLHKESEGVYTFEMPDYDLVVHASFAKTGVDNLGYSFTVTFNKNASKATGTMKKMSGKVTASNTLTANTFKLTGKTFVGWNTKADGSGIPYANKTPLKQIITQNGQALTLYAQWVTTTYEISYQANGGSGAPEGQTKEHGQAITLSSTIPTRTGYTFRGWATSQKNANSGTVKYKPGAAYKDNKKLTLYAVWKANTYKLSFDGNGSTKDTAVSMTITYNKGFTLKGGIFSKNGYVLKGWSLQPHAPAVAYSFDFKPSQKFTAAECVSFVEARGYAGTVTLYAVWGPEEYKISYKCVPAGAASALVNGNPTLYNAIDGVSFTDVSADGYRFVGFYSDSACKKPLTGFAAGVTGAKPVYLKFEPHRYSFRFDPNGGGEKSGTVRSKFEAAERKVGTSYTLPAFSKMFTPPAGYHFSGWEADTGVACVSLKDAQKVSHFPVADGAVVTLKALYAPNTYSVVFNANGGSFTDKKTSKTLAATYDAALAVPAADSLKERSGYAFAGWSTKADGSGETYSNTVSNLSTDNKGKVTLYAVWTYSITLDGNGGTLEGGATTKTLTMKYKSAAVPGEEGFAKPGCTFRGWATTKANANATKPTLLKSGASLKPNATIYASWKVKYTNITVVLHKNFAEEDQVYTVPNQSSAGNLPEAADCPWKTDATFRAWNTQADGKGTEYPDGSPLADIVTESNVTIELYAQYRKGIHLTHHMGSYSLNQADYPEFYEPYGDNEGCCATAFAIGMSIVTGNAYDPTQYWYDGWTHYDWMHRGEWKMYHDLDPIEIVNELEAGHPMEICWIYADSPPARDEGDHFVLIIGVRDDANLNDLQFKDFIVIDPAYGNERSLDESWKFFDRKLCGFFIF